MIDTVRSQIRLSRRALQASLGVALAVLPVMISGAILTDSVKAWACKDCPFPLRVGENKWLMPNGQVEVEIYEEDHNSEQMHVAVYLRDAKTHEPLATGHTLRLKTRSTFFIELEDRGGTAVRGEIRWVNRRAELIQAKFSCIRACTIARFFE